MINVLFYADPLRLYEAFAKSSDVLADHLMRFVGLALLKSQKVDLKVIVSGIAAWQCKDDERFSGVDFLAFSDDDIRHVFPSGKSLDALMVAFFCNRLTDAERASFRRVILDKLNGWVPDVVITYPTSFNIFQEMYPNALCLIQENGIVSRGPFPRSLRYEAVGFMNGFANCYKKEIDGFVISDDDARNVRTFSNKLIEQVRRRYPYASRLDALRKTYRRMVLCPVPAANAYGEAAYDDQIMWLDDVMLQIPKDIGVIVTFHDNVMSQLNARTWPYIQAKYPNLITLEGEGFFAQSFWAFPYVDAVLNCETMTGILAMLFRVKLVSLDRIYSSWAADGIGLNSLDNVLEEPVRPKEGMIYWLLTHFTVFDYRFGDSDWYCRYLEEMLARFRKEGVTFGLYRQVESWDCASLHILQSFENAFATIEESWRAERRRAKRLPCKIGRWFKRIGRVLEDSVVNERGVENA